MKKLPYLCLLLVFVFSLFAVFSISLYAYDVNGYDITNVFSTDISSVEYEQFDTQIINSSAADNIYIFMTIPVSEVINSGNTIDFNLSYVSSQAESIDYILYFYDQNNSQIYSNNGTVTDNSINISKLDLNGDLSKVEIRYTVNNPTWLQDPLQTYYYWNFQVNDVDIIRDDSSILKNILDWIQSIYRNIVNLSSNIATNLMEGMQNLFVPDQEYLDNTFNKYDQLLEDKLGILYQSFDLIIEHMQRFVSMLSTNQAADDPDSGYVEFPSVTVPLAGTEFTFGGWQIKLVPEGFEFLIEALKLITDIVCTLAFINVMYRRLTSTLKGR